MDCRVAICLWLAVLLAVLVGCSEGRTKKVVIHVPYKLKKIKHTHTVYKTIHHHHGAPEHSSNEEHEHFHHMLVQEAAHSAPVPGLAIPEFLPDVPSLPGALPDLPQLPSLPRHIIPLYRRT